MAHVLAEKLSAVEVAPADRRSALEADAVDLILRIWKHRADLPSGKRPFEDLEDLTRTLRRLDVDDEAFRYFNAPPPRGVPGSGKPADEWLQRAVIIDNAARAAIRYCLSAADELTSGSRETWASLGEAAGFQDIVEVRIVRFIADLEGRRRIGGAGDHIREAWRQGREKAALLKEAAEAIEVDVAKKVRAARPRKPKSDAVN